MMHAPYQATSAQDTTFEKHEYDVILLSAGPHKVEISKSSLEYACSTSVGVTTQSIVKCIRNMFGVGLKEAKDLAE